MAQVALVILIGWICVSGYLRHPSRTTLDVALWQNIDASRATQIAHRLIVEWGTAAAVLALAGLLVSVALGAPVPGVSRARRIAVLLLTGVAICGLIRGVQLRHVPSPGHIVLPLTTFLIGAWIGQGCNRGLRALVWRLAQLALAAIAAVVLVLGIAWLALENEPLPFDSTEVSKDAMRKVANTLRGHRSGIEEGRRVELHAQELDLMLAAVLARLSPASKAHVVIAERTADAEMSLALSRGANPRFLNVIASGTAEIVDGELMLHFHRLSIGRLSVPRPLLWLFAPPIASAIRHDTDLRNLVSSIASLQLKDQEVVAVFKPGECSNTFVPALAHAISGKPKVTTQTREHVKHLVEAAATLPQDDTRFVALLQSAFEFARQRSAEEDPLLENRAALLALAVLLGHERVETVVGPVLDDSLREQARRDLQNVTLRGRADWTKHFFVSGAIALVACEGTSNKIGVLKEALDAEDGGSGFSFGDFAANRAGIRLALAATSDEDSARKLQNELSGQFTVDDIFPEVADLPENLTTAALRSKYGGVGGPGYLTILAEIERRLSGCPALQ